MGYILPVDTYQYRDYQNRVTSESRKVHSVDQTFQAILQRNHQDIANQFDQMNKSTHSSSERIISEERLTGKGRNFNQYV